jgi:hypothetical protein
MGEHTDELLASILERLPKPKVDPVASAKANLAAEIAANGIPGRDYEAYEPSTWDPSEWQVGGDDLNDLSGLHRDAQEARKREGRQAS